MTNAIITENANAGSSGWIPANGAVQEIQAYLDKTSYSPGDTLTAYVSTQANADAYTVTIYRLGWYGGLGGRLMNTSSAQSGTNQGYFDGTLLNSCPTAVIDATTHRVEAGWASSYTFAIPGNWITGLYVVVFTNRSKNWYATFSLKGSPTADYVIVIPDATSQVYNYWGGYSGYQTVGPNNIQAYKVSFLRPIWDDHGTGALFNYAVQFIHWAESLGYDLSYLSNVDVHENAALLLNHKVFCCVGHDEYWSLAMRNGVEAAIATGKSGAFLAANTCYWQIRFETDSTGLFADKTVVCYKVGPANGLALATDPQYGVNNATVCCRWQDSPVSRPENGMVGIMYTHSTGDATGAANVGWTVDAAAPTTYFAGTGLVDGSTYGANIIGYEIDATNANGSQPTGLQVIGTSSLAGHTGNTAYYRASAGGFVFASGSICWSWALGGFRYNGTMSTGTPVPQIQTLTQNIMGALKGPVYGNIGR